jgi:hypothetical protein
MFTMPYSPLIIDPPLTTLSNVSRSQSYRSFNARSFSSKGNRLDSFVLKKSKHNKIKTAKLTTREVFCVQEYTI